jgi:hypothetical protein
MGMQLGSSTRAAAPKMRKGREQGVNRKRFSSLYSNAISTSGDCIINSTSRRLRNVAGTLTYREGSPKVKFLSDDGRTSFAFSLREVTAESVVKGVHSITIP